MDTIIVDDDRLAMTSLRNICEKVEDLNVLECFTDSTQAMNWIQKNEVELLFLDIEMPEIGGMEIVKMVGADSSVVFTTSYEKYAVSAFEHQVADYLVKPISHGRLLKTIQKVKSEKSPARVSPPDIFLRVDGRHIRLELDKVLFIESLGDYVTFVTQKEKYIVHSTLKRILERLRDKSFFRVHRSYIVNLSKIIDIEEQNILLSNEKVVPVSRAYKQKLMSMINTS